MSSNESNLIHSKENMLYVFCLIISIIITIFLLFSVVGALIFAFFIFASIFSHALSMSHIRLNGVRLRPTQLPELYQKVETLCTKMEVKVPEVYILESGGILNAFATKVLAFSGKNMVVLYSDYVDLSLESKGAELDYVIAHELAHIKRNHIGKAVFIWPAMWIPFLGVSYLRACEYTCDRMAVYYTESPNNGVQALLVFAAGRRLYKNIAVKEYVEQYNEQKGLLATLTELLSTHPPIPKRIAAIEAFFDTQSVECISRNKQTAFILLTTFLLLPIASIGLVTATENLFSDLDFGFSEAAWEDDWSPLMDASFEGNIDEVERLLNEGADPNEINGFGETALMVSAHNDADIIQLLLDYGADPNHQDDYGWTPLMSTVSVENIEATALLIEAGADPSFMNEEGFSAMEIASDSGNNELMELLGIYKD
ncbi:M48 family metallopeptidase [Halalkalibacter akibai]|uniref:FOG: Ankyrin repeat-like n=1 Tax=Halalkalibacter akibai (strain ATCC 43226 / DSM 21942 / CIP 109018 / JCM 9157 / 1139) TaxID=1236973 RepID=W4QLZ2_HALA3|nr:M48 family metallopeptidase [Halalkalibacter akibai]GAE33140.1 FOG: Ankyrin repeat-like [Halalkalibacter akibai JCM 9157]